MPKTFKTEEEKLVALKELSQSPPPGVDIDKWSDEQEALEREIIEAEIVPEAPTPESQVQKVKESQVLKPVESVPQKEQETKPQADVTDILSFQLKREELPEELRNYKNAEEIVKSFGHARRYANETYEKIKQLEAERDQLAQRLETFSKSKPESKAQEQPLLQQSAEKSVTDITNLLNSMKTADDDFVYTGDVKTVFTQADSIIKNLNAKVVSLESTIVDKISKLEEVTKEREKIETEKRQKESTIRGIAELQEKYPELKTSKPILSLNGGNDSVEYSVQRFADFILSSKYGNNQPGWDQRNAIINAYISGNPEITAYCQNNAITPESVGTTADDIKIYAVIANVDANMNGLSIDPISGKVFEKLSPFNGKRVNFNSYVDSYENLRFTSGIAKQQQQQAIAEAEMRGQQALQSALDVKADIPKTLGNSGSARPEDIGQVMTKEAAEKIFMDPSTQDVIEFAARRGNREPFKKYNAALKVLGMDEEMPDETWPPERAVK